MTGPVRTVEPAPHEFTANYLFDADGLAPWFAADRRVKDGDGSQVAYFDDRGESWKATLYYQESGIVHPGQENPQGTAFEIDTIREFRISIERDQEEDEAGQQSINAHLAPRWKGMQVETSDGERRVLDVPEGLSEAVNVKLAGSNVRFRRYQRLLRRAAAGVGINARYFEDPHPFSNVVDAERYVRVQADRSGPVHARDGPIASLAHLLESDRDGYRKLVQNDRDERGRQVEGYYHTATLGPQRVREAFPNHTFPREIKHYYAREAASMDADDPMAQPKVGASYQVNRWDETIGVTEDDLDELERQLDETIMAVLADAGIPVQPDDDRDGDGGDGRGPWAADPYFDPTREQETRVVSLDLMQIRSSQESVVVKHLADGLSPVEWESLQTLVTDGGRVAPQDIADANDRHVDSVRRALRRIPELVEAEYGQVSLRSNHVAELVHDAVQEAEEATKRAVEAGAKAIEAAERGIDETTSALIAWCSKHGIDVDDRQEARMVIRLRNSESVHDARQRLREAYELWCEAGKDPVRFRSAQVEREGGLAAAHQYLDANRGGSRYVRH